MSPSEINENPVQGEFFSSNLPGRLVREAIQNSLDARAGGAPVKVRFTISGGGALPQDRTARYLSGLRPHFEAVVDAESAAGRNRNARDQRKALAERKALFDAPLPFLAVEDFGTTGLRGDVRANDPQAKGNEFWGLFRSVGISPKGQDAGGSWGLGKWVFPSASKLNAFIGVTRRESDGQLLLMGQAMLKLHKLRGKKHAHYGYYAVASNESDEEWLPMPATAADGQEPFLKQAVADFGLHGRDQTGTSVVVLHPEEELADPNQLAWAAIKQYFWPIVSGDLRVEIVAPGAPARTINAETIAREVHNCGAASVESGKEAAGSMARAIELAAWGASGPPASGAVANRNRPVVSPDDAGDLRARYEAGERLAFNVRAKVGGTLASFKVFVEKDDALSTGHDYYVRGHLHIPGMAFISDHKARALTFVSNRSPLGYLLRDAEGPAHDKWNASAQRLKERGWPAAAERVREAQRAADRILKQLAVQPEEKQRDALADLFPSKPTGRGAKSTGRGEPADAPPAAADPKPVPRIRSLRGGFAVTTEPSDGLQGTAWIVRMAYEVARGTARTAFSRFASSLKAGFPDFSLLDDGLEVDHAGCSVKVVAANELHFVATEPAMSLFVTGFGKRDLLVDVSRVVPPLGSDESADESHPP